jgi:circadian clock protein KaiC
LVENKASLRREIRKMQEQLDTLKTRMDSLVSTEDEGRCKTFIRGFDEKLGGGIPNSHVVLISGPSGTMKSSLALSILSQNIQEGMKGVYLTLDEGKSSLMKTATNLGFEIEESSIVDIGEMRRVEDIAHDAGDWFEVITKFLTKTKKKKKISMVVLDSLDSILSLSNHSSPRDATSAFFHSLRDLDLTALVIDEAENEWEYQEHEDRMADGNIFLTFEMNLDKEVTLMIRCLKMRHTEHSRDYYNLNFENGEFFLSEDSD